MTIEEIKTTGSELHHALTVATQDLVGRSDVVDSITLAAVAGEHVLVVGAPGTAKSEISRRIARALGGQYFEYLLGRFTEPTELFGPIDLRKLRDGIVETETTNMLPEADIVFLDELFLGSTAILNTLLGVLNERTYRRGRSVMRCPLRICIAASNTVPTEESLAAVADRFMVRVFVEPVTDSRLEELLSCGWAASHGHVAASNIATLNHLDVLARAVRTVDMTVVLPHIAEAIRVLRNSGIFLSDRRIVRMQKLVASAAVLDGRLKASLADLWVLVLAVPDHEGQELAKTILKKLISASSNSTLVSLAEQISQSVAARSARLLKDATLVLANLHADRVSEVEGLLREIDSTLHGDDIVGDLADAKHRLQKFLDEYHQ